MTRHRFDTPSTLHLHSFNTNPTQIRQEPQRRQVLGVICKRLRHLPPSSTLDGATVVAVHLLVVFCALPPCVGPASIRMVANASVTTRRLARAAEHRKFCCVAMVGDCLAHWSDFVNVARAMNFPTATWAEEGCRRDTLMQRLKAEEVVLVDAVWRYPLYMLYNQSREAIRRSCHEVLCLALRAQIRSFATRAPRAWHGSRKRGAIAMRRPSGGFAARCCARGGPCWKLVVGCSEPRLSFLC